MNKETTVSCELCSEPTPMLATRRCDRCWELERRIRHDQDLARKILANLDKIGPFIFIKDDDDYASECVITTEADLKHHVHDWLEEPHKSVDELVVAWMKTAKPGDYYSFRLGWFFRINEAKE